MSGDDYAALVDELIRGNPEVDPHRVYARLRHDAPVLRHAGMGVWIVSRHGDVKQVLRDAPNFAPLTEGAGTPVFGRTILQMSGKEHSRKTAIVARRMRNPQILESQISLSVERIVRALIARIRGEVGPVDLKSAYTCPLPLNVITELLAVPEGQHWLHWYQALAAGGVGSITGDRSLRQRAMAARDEIFAYIGPIIDERRRNPGADLLSDIATMEYEGVSLTDHEVRAFVAFLLTAGVETTDRVLSSLLAHVSRQPELWAALRRNPGLVLPVCAEALRMFPPVQALTRRAAAEVTLSGQDIPAGDKLLILLASANRDESVFPDAQRFTPERFMHEPQRQFTGSADILSFGGGVHHCTGAQLARMEMEVGLCHLLDAFRSLRAVGAPAPAKGFVLRSPESVRVTLEAA